MGRFYRNDTAGAIRALTMEILSVVKETGWLSALGAAAETQKRLNQGIDNFGRITGEAAESYNDILTKAGERFGSYADKITESGAKADEYLNALTSAIGELKGLYSSSMLHMETTAETTAETLAFVRQNQESLELLLGGYEAALGSITGEMGGAFSKMADIHIQSSLNSLNESLKENISKITNSNAELLKSFKDAYVNMQTAGKRGAEALVYMKEYIDGKTEDASRAVSGGGEASGG
jgi:hypothetical protein